MHIEKIFCQEDQGLAIWTSLKAVSASKFETLIAVAVQDCPQMVRVSDDFRTAHQRLRLLVQRDRRLKIAALELHPATK
jgi:hypothetical protein